MNEKMLLLDANPTFEVKGVKIPRPGKEPFPIDVVFHFHEAEAYVQMAREMADRPLLELLEKLVAGWGQVAESYSAEALGRMCRTYPKAARTLLRAFEKELYEIEEKN